MFHPSQLKAAEIGAMLQLSSGRMVGGLIYVRVTWRLAVLDLTVGYAGGDNGQNRRDQRPRVECARKEIRSQHN